jgi:capsular polysaccharide biosynthesis protein
MKILRRLALFAFVPALVTTAVGYVAWKSYPAQFRAHSRLHVVAHSPRVVVRSGETEPEVDYNRFKQTQQALVKSQLILGAALRDKTVSAYRMIREQADPVAWLQDNLEVNFIADSEVMEIALSGDDPNEVAGIVNAIKKVYIDEVINVDAKRRQERHSKLKKIKESYQEMLHQRRATLRTLNESATGHDHLGLTGLDRSELLNLYNGLWTKRVDLQLERAEAEAGLPQRQDAEVGAVAKGKDRITERLASLTAQEKVIDERLEQMAGEIRKAAVRALDQEELKEEIGQLEDVRRTINAEVEALNIELQAPPRVRTIEDASPPSTRSRRALWGRLASR